jgi:hypothetical protein
MLPSVDPITLSTNLRFETLYRDLCNNKLNPDGSSALDEKVQKERNIFATVSSNRSLRSWMFAPEPHWSYDLPARQYHLLLVCLLLTRCTQELRNARIEGAKRNLIRSELRNICSDNVALSDEVCSRCSGSSGEISN